MQRILLRITQPCQWLKQSTRIFIPSQIVSRENNRSWKPNLEKETPLSMKNELTSNFINIISRISKSAYLFQSFQQNGRLSSKFSDLENSAISIWRYSFADCRTIIWSTLTILNEKLNRISLYLMWCKSKITKGQCCKEHQIIEMRN